MNVSFTGNHLFYFRNEKIRDAVQQKFEHPEKCLMNRVVLPVDKKELLVLTGKEYKDYKDMLYLYKCAGFNTKYTRKALENSYVYCAAPVDLSGLDSNGKKVSAKLNI